MPLPALISDVELLALSLASAALNDITQSTRDMHRQTASDVVRGKLAPRVSAAMTETFAPNGDVKVAIAAVAAYTLLHVRGFNPIAGADKAIEARYNAALQWLEDVRTAKAELVEYAMDRGHPKVGGSGSSSWENWRNGGNDGS